jgi:hypothetical protein
MKNDQPSIRIAKQSQPQPRTGEGAQGSAYCLTGAKLHNCQTRASMNDLF